MVAPSRPVQASNVAPHRRPPLAFSKENPYELAEKTSTLGQE